MGNQRQENVYVADNRSGKYRHQQFHLGDSGHYLHYRMGLIRSISDTCNALMVIPNLIGVFLLSGTVFQLVREYFTGEKERGGRRDDKNKHVGD